MGDPESADFRALFEAAPFGLHLYRLEADDRLVFAGANAAADRILGVPNGQFVGKAIEEAFPPLAGTEIPERYRAVARTGTPWHTEQVQYEDQRITGAYEVHAFRVRPGEMAAAFQNITDRKQAEQALAEEKEHLAVTLRSIGDAVICTDAVGRVTLMNHVAEALTGWSAREATGRPLVEVFPIEAEGSGQKVEDPASRVLREGTVVGLANHTVLIARDGSRLPISDSGAPIRRPDGAVSGVVLVFRDQTLDRQAEALLLESEARYRAVVRSVPVVQWAVDRDGVFTLSEGLGLAALGLKPGQVVGLTVQEVYGQNPGILDDFQRALAGETFASENRIGAEVFESHWGPVRDDAGAIVGVTGIARHVTAERALREQVARTQKLDSLGRLAGGVAHDFNNLLTVILSCSELLREQTEAGQPASRDDIEQIAAAGYRARELVRQLLAFARKQTMVPQPTDVGAVLRASEPLLRRALGEDLELTLDVQPALWTVLCEPGQLEQAFLNLVINARDAMAGGGALSIRAWNAAGAEGGADEVRVAIRDTGAGMSDEVRAHLFEPFFTTKAPGEGTGLGLAIVYGVVSQSGGRIQVESAVGRGTTFELSFPRCDRQPIEPSAAPPTAALQGGSETVLVVDDNPLVRWVTTRILRSAGYRVLVAGDGREALAMAVGTARGVDLVVTDVVMPGVSGTELARRLEEVAPKLRVLFVSGYSREVVAERGLDRLEGRFLAKPFTASGLLERVRQILDLPRATDRGDPPQAT
jgi:two-component system cell cycle sensor histidine kinase/response regulator CckA